MSARSSVRSIALLVPALLLFGACAESPPPAPVAPPAPPPAATAPPATVAPPAAPPPVASAAPVAPPPAEAPRPVEPPRAVEPPKPAVAARSGEAVYYDANGRGACALAFTHDAAVLSAPDSVYNSIQACGQCLEITGPGGTELVQVVDRCSSCPDNQLVINKPAFDKIAGKGSSGREKITFKPAPCNVEGTLELRFKASSSQYWTAIQVRNHRLPIKGVAWKRDGQWVEMTRSNDNFFVAEKGVGAGGLTLRITASDGQVIEHTWEKWKDGEKYRTAEQFK